MDKGKHVDENNIPEKLKHARYHVIAKYGFLGTLVWNMQFVETKELPTLAIDKWGRIYYNPDFVESLSPKEAIGTFLHEIWHLMLQHFSRANRINNLVPQVWNLAGDCCINRNIIRDGFEMRNCITSQVLKLPDNLLEEAYYKLLMENAKEMPQVSAGSGSDGQAHDWELGKPTAENPGITEEQQQGIREAISSEIRARGINGGGWDELAEAIFNPKINWKQQLAVAIRKSTASVRGKTDFSTQYRNPKQVMVNRMKFPYRIRGFCSHQPRIVIVGDTSGSISNTDRDRIATEVNGLAKQGNAELYWIATDAEVQAESKLKGSANKLNFKGRGGTDMCVGISRAEELKPRFDILIVMTDCWTPWPAMAPNFAHNIIVQIGKGGDLPQWKHTLITIEDPKNDV